MPIRYVIGDATRPQADGPAIIVHVCNDIGGWGRGFVLAISKRWSEPEIEFRKWARGDLAQPYGLGEVQLVQIEPELWVANLVGQHGVRRRGGAAPVRYEAIREGLGKVAKLAIEVDASVHMPRIGCGLAGGRWEEVGPIVSETLSNLDVTVYDFES